MSTQEPTLPSKISQKMVFARMIQNRYYILFSIDQETQEEGWRQIQAELAAIGADYFKGKDWKVLRDETWPRLKQQALKHQETGKSPCEHATELDQIVLDIVQRNDHFQKPGTSPKALKTAKLPSPLISPPNNSPIAFAKRSLSQVKSAEHIPRRCVSTEFRMPSAPLETLKRQKLELAIQNLREENARNKELHALQLAKLRIEIALLRQDPRFPGNAN